MNCIICPKTSCNAFAITLVNSQRKAAARSECNRLISTVDEMIQNGCMHVELTRDELGIINNARNEICNGIDLEGELDTRMGCTVEEARAVLAKIHGFATNS
jgi:hypothetical protein